MGTISPPLPCPGSIRAGGDDPQRAEPHRRPQGARARPTGFVPARYAEYLAQTDREGEDTAYRHCENINFFGVITVDVEEELAKIDPVGGRRPLRPQDTGLLWA
ncbi:MULTISPECIES: hypothetical protein [Actinomadura]|uniref:Uncharacterized protein n=1 Tax=Actinomadura yumaensis TaxID=111807 RepID=A0ABW2CE59_9ACTN|nr:hypothetical protein [Actinomadura sp. J1-007]MWK38312.1 hypothetical protein [Actinomadura sp. J1-007]